MSFLRKPAYPKRADSEYSLFNDANLMQNEAGQQFAPGMRLRLADITDPTDERFRAARTASADAWQADAAAPEAYDSTRPGLSAFARALTRGRALSRQVLNSKEQVDMQLLRDRIAAAKAGMGIRTGNVRDLFSLTSGLDQMNAAKMQASQMTNASYANMAGTLGGIAARAIPYYMDQRSRAVIMNQSQYGMEPVKIQPITVTAQKIGP